MSDRASTWTPPDDLVEGLTRLAQELNPQVKGLPTVARRQLGEQMARIGAIAATLPAPRLVTWVTQERPRATTRLGRKPIATREKIRVRENPLVLGVLREVRPSTVSVPNFSTFYRNEFARLVSSLVVVGSPADVAVNVAQMAMVTVQSDWEHIDDPAVVVRRHALKLLRDPFAQNHDESVANRVLAENPSVLNAVIARNLFVRVVHPLSQTNAEILMWHVTGSTEEEIAREVSLSTGEVHSHLRRVRQQIQTAIAELAISEPTIEEAAIEGPYFGM